MINGRVVCQLVQIVKFDSVQDASSITQKSGEEAEADKSALHWDATSGMFSEYGVAMIEDKTYETHHSKEDKLQ